MAEGRNELVEVRIDARPHDELYSGFGLAALGYALANLLVGPLDERSEQMMQRIFAHRLHLMGLRMMARLGAVVVVTALPRRSSALHALRFARGSVASSAVVGNSARVSVRRAAHGVYPIRRKGLGDALLRHYGSIEREGGARGDDLRAQRAGGGRVDEAGVPRVSYSMDDGGLAVVGIGERGMSLDAAVWARLAAGDQDHGGLRARREAGRRGEGPSTCHRGLSRGDGGGIYMV